ncbi:MAG: ABC transporter permease subunit [Acidobacteriota bacterium]|nr:ABC transporter permease subunit [Acidobacteriota bacterium]
MSGDGSRDEFEDALLRAPRRDSFDVVVGSEMSTAWLAATVRQQEGVLRQLARDRAAVVGLVIIALLAALALAAPLIAPHDPATQHLHERLAAPNLTFPLGTDNLGRCLLSRLLYGARVSLTAATAASVLVLLIGVSVGAIAGYAGGWVDMAIMRLVDLLLAFPLLVLALAITGFIGVGMGSVLVGVVSVWWASYARIVRGLVLSLRERPFVEAARAMGASPARIVIRHLIPNVLPPIIVLATLEMGSLLLVISGLNFLGLGVQPPTPEWGAMLNDGRPFLRSAPQLMIYPGLAISLAVMGFNLLGDGLRDKLDPRLK